jgi:hypothetical protein
VQFVRLELSPLGLLAAFLEAGTRGGLHRSRNRGCGSHCMAGARKTEDDREMPEASLGKSDNAMWRASA